MEPRNSGWSTRGGKSWLILSATATNIGDSHVGSVVATEITIRGHACRTCGLPDRAALVTGRGTGDDTIIAMVNGRSVKYGDVKLRPDADILLMRFRQRHGRDPESEADREEMQRAWRAYEIANLAKYLRAAVRREQLDKFGIEPTAQEIERRWKRWEREREAEGEPIDRDAMAREGRENLRQILEALKEVIDEGQDADDVYERRLAGKMSRKEWRLRLQYEGTPQKRKQLEGLLTLPEEDLFDLRDGFRKVLVIEQLKEAIEEELVRTDPEFAEYMRLARTDPSNEKAQSKGPNYRAAKRYEWWRQRYREAKIEINDERFKGALKELLK